jgi:hypothetical protein
MCSLCYPLEANDRAVYENIKVDSEEGVEKGGRSNVKETEAIKVKWLIYMCILGDSY